MNFFRKGLFLVSLPFLISLSFLGCSAEETDYQKGYQSVLLLQLSSSVSNPITTCGETLNRQVQCFKNFCERNTGFEDFCLAQVLQGLGLPTNLGSGGSTDSTCTTILNGSSFQKMSERSKNCILDCQRVDWNTKISSNECKNSTSLETVLRNTSNSTQTACLRACFQSTNSRPTEAETQNLLILNIIQEGAR